MARTAFVLTEDGSTVHPVTDYVAVLEGELADFYPGETYRDLFKIQTGSVSAINGGSVEGLFYPDDGTAPVYGLGTVAQKARLSDELAHTPPRDVRNKQTRLRFYAGLQYAFTGVAADDTFVLPAGHELSIGDMVTCLSEGTLPAGLASATVYYVVAVSPLKVKLSATYGGTAVNITDAGTGAHTLYARVKIADFKPGSWVSWTNTKPLRY